jgi:glycosyltransferase involved in cell wall biosynthesis
MSRVLVVTLPPFAGGVPAKCRVLVDHLRRRGHEVTVAYYATLSDHPELVAPSWTPWRRPTTLERTVWDGVGAVAVGCRFPELEFPYYLPSERWDRLIKAHDRHIAVGGTVLASYPLVAAGLPHITWCAATMIEDRRDRRAAMPWPRRLIDEWVVGPVQARMERRILAGRGLIRPVSGHTARLFQSMGAGSCPVMPIPVDCTRFHPPATPAVAGIVGFAARLNDPRKNLGLLIEAVALAVAGGADLRLRLAGDMPHDELAIRLSDPRLAERVDLVGELSLDQLPAFYAGLDIFAIPSHQEGFGIVGMEAMASGLPVVSTRCGGPEDYVIPGETGILVDDSRDMAACLARLTADRALRNRLGVQARTLAETRYSHENFAATLAQAWAECWGDGP